MNSKEPGLPSKAVIFAAIAIPIVFYYASVLVYASNIPVWDDYDAVLNFLIKYTGAGTLSTRIELLLYQHNEHRIFIVRAASALMRLFCGEVDFRILAYVGNLSLLGLAAALYFMIRVDGYRPLYFLPVALLLFQFQYYDNILWSMAALSNFYVLFFTFASLLLLAKEGRGPFAAAAILALLSAYTQGSGIFAFAAGLVLLFFSKRYPRLAAWTILYAAVLAFYFKGYIKPEAHPDAMNGFSDPLLLAGYFFAFAGSFIGSFVRSAAVAMLAGVFFTGFLAWITSRRYYRENPAVYCAFIYLFLTALAAAISRSGLGVDQALTSRYRIVSVLFPILSYIAFIDLKKESMRRALPAFIALAFLFSLGSDLAYHRNLKRKQRALTEGLARWAQGGEGLNYPDQKTADRILREAIEKGLYRPPLNGVEIRP